MFNISHFVKAVGAAKWNPADREDASALQASTEELRMELSELSRRISCAGGGCVPVAAQLAVWNQIAHHCTKQFVVLLSRLRRRKEDGAQRGAAAAASPVATRVAECYSKLATQLGKLRLQLVNDVNAAAASSSSSSSGGGAASQTTTPAPALCVGTTNHNDCGDADFTAYFNDYFHAHSLQGVELVQWCQRQAVYPVAVLAALVGKQSEADKRAITVAEVEGYFCDVVRGGGYGLRGDGSRRRFDPTSY
eukprot:GHVU01228458.1.p1 GENE.GHVU01228458.1~~GHVU01228458.1.p1  ORF type:complete len:250 (-),score=58.15 GHVU01228458.1:55-804(-)